MDKEPARVSSYLYIRFVLTHGKVRCLGRRPTMSVKIRRRLADSRYSDSLSVARSLRLFVTTGTIRDTVCRAQHMLLALNCKTDLLDHAEAVGVVSLEVARTHEGENGHDVVQDRIGNESSQFRGDE